MFTETDYQQALNLLPGTDLQKAVRLVNDALKKLDQFGGTQARINELIHEAAQRNKGTPDRATKKVSIYQRFYLTDLAEKHGTWVRSQVGRENAIRYLLLFYRECMVRLRCIPGQNGYEPYRSETGNFIIDGPDRTDYAEATIYDLFYWRTNRDDIGVAKLRLADNWQRAELIYQYRSSVPGRERSFLSGPTHWGGDNTLYMHLQDTPSPDNRAELTHVFLSLFVHEDTHKRQYIAGVFASSNRDTHDPICGMVLLQRNDTNPDINQSDFVQLNRADPTERVPVNIPDNVFHAVSNTRMKVAPRPILESLQVPYTQEIRQLLAFAGTYQAYQPQPTDCLRLMKLDIEPSGRVVLTRKNSVETGYVDYCAGVLMLKFAYMPETASYRFHLILEKAANEGDMTGIYAGLDNENIVSTRLYLRRIANGKLAQLLEQCRVSRAFLTRLTASGPAVAAFLTDPRLLTTDAFWTYQLNRLAVVDLKPGNPVVRPKPIGQFNAFFLSVPADDADGSEDRVQLIGLPLRIEENQVFISQQRHTLRGYFAQHDERQLTIRSDDPLFRYELTIELPQPAPGVLSQESYTRLIGFMRSESGSKPLMLCWETDEQWLIYRTCDQLTDMLTLDRRYAGLASFLFDDRGQPVGTPSAVRELI